MDQQTDKELINRWKQSIDEFIIQDIRKCVELDFLESGLIILALTGAECISGYFCGREADKDTFCEFLASKYFPGEYQELSRNIYECLRNGLVHDHTNKNNVFTLFRKVGDAPHLHRISTDKGETITFNREVFARDLVRAWENYSGDVTTDRNLEHNFMKRINDKDRGFLVVKDIHLYNHTETDQTEKEYVYSGGTVGWWEV